MTMSSIPFILIVIKTLVGTATSACSNPIGKQTMSCFYSYTMVMMISGIKENWKNRSKNVLLHHL